MAYKLRPPFERIYIAGYRANPILYSMISKNAAWVYPQAGLREPAMIGRLRNQLLGGRSGGAATWGTAF